MTDNVGEPSLPGVAHGAGVPADPVAPTVVLADAALLVVTGSKTVEVMFELTAKVPVVLGRYVMANELLPPELREASEYVTVVTLVVELTEIMPPVAASTVAPAGSVTVPVAGAAIGPALLKVT